ncbi:hypothetical protein MRCP2_p0230 (plasmid) [Aquipseudomonas alcaligenes]|nr:hypothetical protein MRCP2_p0230 [Pseudomonas alcaligenes]
MVYQLKISDGNLKDSSLCVPTSTDGAGRHERTGSALSLRGCEPLPSLADAPETLVSNFGDLGVLGYGAMFSKKPAAIGPCH